MTSGQIQVRAIVDFSFSVSSDTDEADLLEEILDRIRSGEYFPSDVVSVKLVPQGLSTSA